MSLNLVIPNKDNRVALNFNGVDLTVATDIRVDFGAETYTLLLDPAVVIVDSATQLSLDLSGTSEVGKVFVEVTYFDVGSTNGSEITSRELANLSQIIVAIGSQLIVEDGTIVDDANTFATDEELKTYAALRCLPVPSTQPDREALLVKAMDYLFRKESSMQGSRVSQDQELPWPRYGVCARGFSVNSGSIPKDIKRAQMELALQANESDLLINENSKNIIKEKLDVLEVEYASGGSWATVRTDRADAFMLPYMINGGNSNIMKRVMR